MESARSWVLLLTCLLDARIDHVGLDEAAEVIASLQRCQKHGQCPVSPATKKDDQGSKKSKLALVKTCKDQVKCGVYADSQPMAECVDKLKREAKLSCKCVNCQPTGHSSLSLYCPAWTKSKQAKKPARTTAKPAQEQPKTQEPKTALAVPVLDSPPKMNVVTSIKSPPRRETPTRRQDQ